MAGEAAARTKVRAAASPRQGVGLAAGGIGATALRGGASPHARILPGAAPWSQAIMPGYRYRADAALRTVGQRSVCSGPPASVVLRVMPRTPVSPSRRGVLR